MHRLPSPRLLRTGRGSPTATGQFARDGFDAGGYAGVHARSAIGGFTGRFSLEPEIIVALPPELTRAIIANRGWVFPLIPSMYDKVVAARKKS